MVAIDTIFGHLLHGVVRQPEESASLMMLSTTDHVRREEVDVLLKRIFDLDSSHPLDDAVTTDPAMLHFQETVVQLPNKQYQLRLPLKPNRPTLRTNYRPALQQLLKLIQKWKNKSIDVLLKYHNEILGFLSSDFVELVPTDEIEADGLEYHYSPHMPVIKPEKNTTIRPMFDASHRSDRVGQQPSLNDCLWTGENHLPLMWEVLQRLRLWKFPITADIRKAFLHLCIDPRDRNLQRFLWVEDPMADKLVIRHLRWKVAMFGATCSPLQLHATIENHVVKFQEEYARTTKLLLRDRFMYDLTTGADTKEEALKIANESKFIISEAGMNLERWQANDPELQKLFNETLNKREPSLQTGAKATSVGTGTSEFSGQTSSFQTGAKASSELVKSNDLIDSKSTSQMGAKATSEELEMDDVLKLFDSSLKVLGSVWKRNDDVFTFETKVLEEYCATLRHRTCLRTVLSICARLYDVLGLITPVTITSRIIMQRIWRKKLHWDQELPSDLKEEFWSWIDGLKHLSDVKVPRHFFFRSERPNKLQLHVFCDAS